MTDFKLSRLRSGEWIAGGAAVVLLVAMVFTPWYGLRGVQATFAGKAGRSTTITGWDEFIHLRWLILLTIILGLALAIAQAARRAPALPVTLDVLALVLAVLTSLWLIYRVLIVVPGSGTGASVSLSQKPWAYVGLLSARGLTFGAFRSLRQETPADPAANALIPVVRLPSDGEQ